MPSRDDVLDALMDGASVEAVADRFGLREGEVRDILKAETDRAYDAEALRAEWTSVARRLRRLELAFDRKAIEELDCAAAAVSIKASERRATLTGANAQPAHLVTIMNAHAIEHTETSTENLKRVLDELRNEPRLDPPAEPNV